LEPSAEIRYTAVIKNKDGKGAIYTGDYVFATYSTLSSPLPTNTFIPKYMYIRDGLSL
jgi:hypothetical protein